MNEKFDTKKFALIGGSVMLVIGLVALIPSLSVRSNALPALNIESSYGYFLGTFAMNIINKVFLILMGIAGIASSSNTSISDSVHIHKNYTNQVQRHSDDEFRASAWWARILLYVTAAFTILGLLRSTNTLGGYMPLFGSNIWLHALFAVCGAYFGYAAYHDPFHRTDLHKI